MEADASSPHRTRGSIATIAMVATIAALVLAVFTASPGIAEAQQDSMRDRQARPAQDRVDVVRDRPVRDVETLRLACAPDFIDGHRGVLCRWSEATNPNTRAYQLYKITNGSARELVTTVGVDGRLAFFDRNVSAPSSLVYGVISLNHNGRVIGRSEAVHVQFGHDIEELRLACAPDSIDGQRGVLCRWSEAHHPDIRGYLVYRIVGDHPREVIARVGLDARRAHFDTEVVPGAVHTYGVTAVDTEGRVVAIGGPSRVHWPAAD